MIKNIIAPVQTWLISQKRCVGCGSLLKDGKKQINKKLNLTVCKCTRVYIKEKTTGKFRRAKLTEI